MDEKIESFVLGYTVHKFSSYSANYVPENIMINNPEDQLSRWFTDSSTQCQFLMLKLDAPGIVETIKFGKYIKAHVSNLKKFQVYGGTEENNMSLLLSAGLKNDSTPEVFRLRHKTSEGLYLPVQYLKIVPVQSWGPAYNYTIWYVELMGKKQENFVSYALETINLRKEEEAVRLLLKHLRRRRYKDAFEALSRETGVRLEGPVQTRLWNTLVERGDYKMTEDVFREAVNAGEVEWYLSWQPYVPEWRLLSACSAAVQKRLDLHLKPSPRPAQRSLERSPEARAPPSPPPPELRRHRHRRAAGRPGTPPGRSDSSPEPGDLPQAVGRGRPIRPQQRAGGRSPTSRRAYDEDFECITQHMECGPFGCSMKPGPRGGHQLIVDSHTGTLYLFGGWNGREDLDDLWSYSTREEKWRLLCRSTAEMGGPSPRSCHKMVFDPTQRRIYTLGRYVSNALRVPSNLKGDMYVYDVASGSWSLLCEDTAAAGGPRLVFDHQMCIDADTHTIYVFGGRVLLTQESEGGRSQYSGLYAYYTRTGSWQALLPDSHSMRAPQPRISHSMLFHPVQRRLYIFAGQKHKEHLLDLWWWDVSTNECQALCEPLCAPLSQAGLTQRATLDPDADEMYVLSGLSKHNDHCVYNTLWVYSFRRRSWSCAYRNERATPHEPCPRFAHQLVFDPHTKIHYLFGGNPGQENRPRLRLDDLWSLRLKRPAPLEVFHKARSTIREAAYRALCASPTNHIAALEYLRSEINEVVDHTDPQQVSRFQKLATALFSGGGAGAASGCVPLSAQRVRTLARRRAHAPSSHDLAHALAAVLGAEEAPLEPSLPFEEMSEPEPETWEVGRDEDGATPSQEWLARESRMKLYEELARYFPPSTVPPAGDVMELVTL